MPQFAPFSYGNVLAQTENIRGARTQNALAQQRLDPSSPQNQLIREQLAGARQGNVMAQTRFDQEQQQENTKQLYQALTEISENPAAADFHVPRLKKMGILRTDFDHTNMTPEEISAKARQGAQALGKALNMGAQASKPVKQVQSSKILPGGAIQILYDDGSTEVKSPKEAEAEIVRSAEQRGVSLQQQRAQGREIGKGGGKMANEAIETASQIRANNESLRKVIDLVGKGAETGPLSKRLPSFRAQSVRLDNLRKQLGLDVIGAVTFGALSEGELQLALDTALPTGLDGPELVRWAQDKINAQEKLANYLEEQAIFLSKPGNTPADWIEKLRSQTPQTGGPVGLPPRNEQGWQLMEDAQGNKAYVGPNGEIQEVQ